MSVEIDNYLHWRTPEDKSEMLAKLMEWEVSSFPPHGDTYIHVPGYDNIFRSFYKTRRMAHMWRVLNWAWRQHDPMDDPEDPDETIKYWTWRLMTVLWKAGEMEPELAIRHILDSILRLAFGANMIEICDESENKNEPND